MDKFDCTLLCICSEVDLIISLINGVNLPRGPLQLLADIVDKAKVKQVNWLSKSICF